MLNATSRHDFLGLKLEALCSSADAAQATAHAPEACVTSDDVPVMSSAVKARAVATEDPVSQTPQNCEPGADRPNSSHQETDKQASHARSNAHAHADFLGPLNSHSTEVLGVFDRPRPSTADTPGLLPSRPLSVRALTLQRTYTSTTHRDAEMDEYAVLDYKPKVKLFPRPVTDTKVKRTSTTTSTQKMPAGTRANWTVKQANDKKLSKSLSTKQRGSDVLSKPVRSKTSPTQRPAARIVQASPALDTHTKDPVAISVDSSVHEMRSVPSLVPSSSFYTIPIQRNLKSQQSAAQMVEKERLMKALQLRRQQMASARQLDPSPAHLEISANGGLDKADSGIGAESEDDGREQAPSLLPSALRRQLDPSNNTTAGDSVHQWKEQGGLVEDEPDHSSQPHVDSLITTSEGGQTMLRPRHRIRTAGEAEKRLGLLEPIRIRVSVETSEADSTVDGSFLEELGKAEMREATPVLISQPSLNTIGTGYRLAATRPTVLDQQSGVDLHTSVKLHTRQASYEMASPASSDGPTSPMESSEPPPIRTLRRSQERAYRLALGEDPFLDKSATVKRNLSSGISRRIQTLVDVSRRQPKRSTFMSTMTDLDTAGPALIPQDGSSRTPSDRPGGLTTRPATRDGSSGVINNMMVEGMPRRSKTMSHLYDSGASAYFSPATPRVKDDTFDSAAKKSETGSRTAAINELPHRTTVNGNDTSRLVHGLDASLVQDRRHDLTYSPTPDKGYPPRSRGSEVTHDSSDNLAGLHSRRDTCSGAAITDGAGSPLMSERRASKASRLLKRLSSISTSPRSTSGNDTTLYDNSAEQAPSIRTPAGNRTNRFAG